MVSTVTVLCDTFFGEMPPRTVRCVRQKWDKTKRPPVPLDWKIPAYYNNPKKSCQGSGDRSVLWRLIR